MFPIIQQEEPANFVPWNLSYVYATHNPYTPPEPSPPLATIIEPEPITEYVNTITCDCLTFAKQFNEKIKDVSPLYNPFYLWKYHRQYELRPLPEPEIGTLVITTENSFVGHIGVVASTSETKILVLDKNFKPCEIMWRELEKTDDNIVGYLR